MRRVDLPSGNISLATEPLIVGTTLSMSDNTTDIVRSSSETTIFLEVGVQLC